MENIILRQTNEEGEFSAFVRQKGLKFTPDRRAILNEIFLIHKHFDIDEIYERLKKKGKKVSRATIYRTLPLLLSGGFIKEVTVSRYGITYEHTLGHSHHDHLICIKCGKIIEFCDKNIEKLQNTICKKEKFLPIEHKLSIRGYCKRCGNKVD
jgi:Fur family ferric uptake transcriptional regulator